MVESANKLVVEARLKGAGMHWERTNVNPMLTLRNGVCNERWQETWQVAVSHHRHQRLQRRTARAAQRAQSVVPSCEPLPLEAPPPAPQPASQQPSPPVVPAATLPGSCRPSAHHPWKRGPACAPKMFAKF